MVTFKEKQIMVDGEVVITSVKQDNNMLIIKLA
jgi:hypothetical protein